MKSSVDFLRHSRVLVSAVLFPWRVTSRDQPLGWILMSHMPMKWVLTICSYFSLLSRLVQMDLSNLITKRYRCIVSVVGVRSFLFVWVAGRKAL